MESGSVQQASLVSKYEEKRTIIAEFQIVIFSVYNVKKVYVTLS